MKVIFLKAVLLGSWGYSYVSCLDAATRRVWQAALLPRILDPATGQRADKGVLYSSVEGSEGEGIAHAAAKPKAPDEGGVAPVAEEPYSAAYAAGESGISEGHGARRAESCRSAPTWWGARRRQEALMPGAVVPCAASNGSVLWEGGRDPEAAPYSVESSAGPLADLRGPPAWGARLPDGPPATGATAESAAAAAALPVRASKSENIQQGWFSAFLEQLAFAAAAQSAAVSGFSWSPSIVGFAPSSQLAPDATLPKAAAGAPTIETTLKEAPETAPTSMALSVLEAGAAATPGRATERATTETAAAATEAATEISAAAIPPAALGDGSTRASIPTVPDGLFGGWSFANLERIGGALGQFFDKVDARLEEGGPALYSEIYDFTL